MTASRDYVIFGETAMSPREVRGLAAFHRAHREDNMDIIIELAAGIEIEHPAVEQEMDGVDPVHLERRPPEGDPIPIDEAETMVREIMDSEGIARSEWRIAR